MSNFFHAFLSFPKNLFSTAFHILKYKSASNAFRLINSLQFIVQSTNKKTSKMKFFVAAFALIASASAGSVSYVKRSDNNGHGYESSGLGGGLESFGGQGGLGESYGAGYGGDFYAYPKYKFEYGVKDVKTGDHKSQWEIRDGDVVKGEYTLDEADGTKRVVEYHADGKSGFHAIVKKIGHAHHNIGGGYGQGGFGQGF